MDLEEVVESEVNRTTLYLSGVREGIFVYEGIVKYYGSEQTLDEGRVTVLVNDTTASVHLNTVPIRTIDILDLSDYEEFSLEYRTQRFPGRGFELLSLANELRERLNIFYLPIKDLLQKDDKVYLSKLSDVALVDKSLLVYQGLSLCKARNVLAEAKRKNFLNYIFKDRSFVLIPRGFENEFYSKKHFIVDYSDFEIVDNNALELYCAENNLHVPSITPSSTILINGEKYYPRIVVDALAPSIKTKKVLEDIPEFDGLFDLHNYNPLGKVSENVYYYKDREVSLFRGELVKYGEVFNKFTSSNILGIERKNFQAPLRKLIFGTSAVVDRRFDNGVRVPKEHLGRGQKYFLKVTIANKCLQYLVDNGFNAIRGI